MEASSYGETIFEEAKRLLSRLGERLNLAPERTKPTEHTARKIWLIGDITIQVTIQRIRKRMP
jgi:methyl coenzyme M reductase subunit D